ncbi:MAG: hypothetical protein IJS60_05495 [Abditibacteriota bacterium]|nr:hypothetical protein [Abditibacteriota bacterium]
MNRKEWAKIIGINEECFKTIEENKLPEEIYTSLKDIWNGDFNILAKRLTSGEFSFAQILSFYFHLCYEYRTTSGDKDFENGIFDSGMNNIEVWARDCYEKHGYYGLVDFGWIDKVFRKIVVRLGRLEFEPDKSHDDIIINNAHCTMHNAQLNAECKTVTPLLRSRGEFGGSVNSNVKRGEGVFFIPKGTDIINVHIPATGPLNYEECRKSYKQCLEYYNLKEAVFICESWLLSPLLEEMLPETSNIIKFKNDYKIYKLDIMDRLFEERIFGDVLYDNPNLYVAKTSLQKKAKEILRQGRPLLGAWGIKLYKGE